LVIVILCGVTAVAAWGSFAAGGAYAPQPRFAKSALAATFLIALFALSFIAKVFVGRQLEPGTRYAYLLDRQGQLLGLYDIMGEVVTVTDLDGHLPQEFEALRPDLHALIESAAPEARVDLIKRQSYRSCNRSLIEYKNVSRPGNEVWWYVPDR